MPNLITECVLLSALLDHEGIPDVWNIFRAECVIQGWLGHIWEKKSFHCFVRDVLLNRVQQMTEDWSLSEDLDFAQDDFCATPYNYCTLCHTKWIGK